MAGRIAASRAGAATASLLASWALPIALVLVWELAARSGWLSARVLPAPSAVAVAFWENLRNGTLLTMSRSRPSGR